MESLRPPSPLSMTPGPSHTEGPLPMGSPRQEPVLFLSPPGGALTATVNAVGGKEKKTQDAGSLCMPLQILKQDQPSASPPAPPLSESSYCDVLYPCNLSVQHRACQGRGP